MFGPKNVLTKGGWLTRARLWRVVLLQHPDGFWDPSESLAAALLAQSVDSDELLEAKKKSLGQVLLTMATKGKVRGVNKKQNTNVVVSVDAGQHRLRPQPDSARRFATSFFGLAPSATA